MAETTYFPRRLILGGAVVMGVLLALAVHMLGARYGLDLGGLWRADTHSFMPPGAAIAWWLIATVGFCGGYFTATLMHSAVSGQIPERMRQFLIVVGVLLLAGAGLGLLVPPLTSALLGSVEKSRSGVAAGVLNATRQTGSVLGVALFGSLIGSRAGFVAGTHGALLISASVLLLGAAAMQWGGKASRGL